MTFRPNQIPLTHNQMDARLEKPEPRVEKHDNGTLPHETPPPPSFKQRRRKKPKQPKRSKR